MAEKSAREAVAEYPESSLLVGAAQSVWDGSTALVRIEIGVAEKLGERMAEEGIAPLECVFITDSDIRHIKRGHAEGEESRGQASLAPEDFGIIPRVLNEFETCEHTDTDRLGNKRFLLTKEVGGIWYVVTVQRGKRKLQIKTMWKRNVPGASC